MQVEVISAITLGAVILGALVNIIGIVSKHDTQVRADANRDVKLDMVLERLTCISTDHRELKEVVQNHSTRLVVVEGKVDSLERIGVGGVLGGK